MFGWKGYTFQASKYMNGYHFHIKVKFEKWCRGHFSILEVYEWAMSCLHLALYMNWVELEDSSRTSIPKIMASPPPQYTVQPFLSDNSEQPPHLVGFYDKLRRVMIKYLTLYT